MSIDQSHMLMVGRMACDPEKKSVGQSVVVEFRIATNYSYRDKTGEWQDGDTSYFNVQCWDRLGFNVLRSLKKGDPVIVYGRMVQSTWKFTNDHGEEETRSMLRMRASYAGVDLNQRTVESFPDEKKARQIQEKQRELEERAAAMAASVAGNTAESAQPDPFGAADDRELPLADEEQLASA